LSLERKEDSLRDGRADPIIKASLSTLTTSVKLRVLDLWVLNLIIRSSLSRLGSESISRGL